MLSESEKSLEKSNFYSNLSNEEKELIKEIEERIRRDTKNEMTDIEYYHLASLTYFCDNIEDMMQSNGLDSTPPVILMEYRKLKTAILSYLQKWREGSIIKKNTMEELKKALKEVREKEVETIVLIPMETKDGSAVGDRASEEDEGSN